MTTPRQYILHAAHDWYGEGPVVHWSESDSSMRRNSFRVSNVGNCLYLKLCGFVDAEKAVIQDVNEQHLQLQVGGSRFRSLLSSEACPLDLEIRLRSVENDKLPESEVEITIRDRRWRKQPNLFETAARRVLFQLQNHLMANH